MTNDSTINMEGLFKGADLSGAQIIAVNNGEVCYCKNNGEQTAGQQAAPVETLLKAVNDVRPMFWAKSSIAVIYCVCRDRFGYAGSMTQFEKDFGCSGHLLSDTFSDNDYMRYPVDKWRENGAKERAIKLAEQYQKNVERLLGK